MNVGQPHQLRIYGGVGGGGCVSSQRSNRLNCNMQKAIRARGKKWAKTPAEKSHNPNAIRNLLDALCWFGARSLHEVPWLKTGLWVGGGLGGGGGFSGRYFAWHLGSEILNLWPQGWGIGVELRMEKRFKDYFFGCVFMHLFVYFFKLCYNPKTPKNCLFYLEEEGSDEEKWVRSL